MRLFPFVKTGLAMFGVFAGLSTVYAQNKPNIVLVMADDMGFSDIGCYGGEIPTPNIDKLAKNGVRFTQFYNTARCSPTRASLLTGLHPHQAGMGRLAEERIGITTQNPEGYLGYLNNRCITIAEALKPAGYKTYLAGKWHLGQRDESKWPLQRGFDRFYGLLTGASSFFRPEGVRGLTLDNEQLPAPATAGYYTTDAFTDFAVQTIREHQGDDPFFIFLSFTAPHWPLHARPEDIVKFVGKYRSGWDNLRDGRHKRMKKMGIMNKEWPLSLRDDGARAWDTLSEQEKTDLDYRMAVYAAQVHRMDWNIGRLVETLREKGQLDNTLIVFLSDNGACAEPYTDLGGMTQEKINDPAVSGNISYGTGWANSSNTPFRKFKSMMHEGGISTPLILHWPAGVKAKPGSLNNTPGYLPDIMPTFLEVSGAVYPKEYKGQPITPLEGRSLLPILNEKSPELTPRVMCWEQYEYKAVRVGDMKAVFSPEGRYDKLGSGQWELYDLAKDRTESQNLAAKQPERLKELIAHWDAWAARCQVFPAPGAVVKK